MSKGNITSGYYALSGLSSPSSISSSNASSAIASAVNSGVSSSGGRGTPPPLSLRTLAGTSAISGSNNITTITSTGQHVTTYDTQDEESNNSSALLLDDGDEYSLEELQIDCPLCLENMDSSDCRFRPCPCGYQVLIELI